LFPEKPKYLGSGLGVGMVMEDAGSNTLGHFIVPPEGTRVKVE
jgi:hypothetical protein